MLGPVQAASRHLPENKIMEKTPFARGDFTEGSDYDFLIVLDERKKTFGGFRFAT